jgi:hypothetical protein
MYLSIKLTNPTLVNLSLICPEDTERRLKRTCFRGRNQKLAGNFMLWESVKAVFTGSVLNKLTEDVVEQWELGKFFTHSITFEMPLFVGWESTINKELCSEAALEEFFPNKKSRALRVRPDYTELLAPLTKDITIVYQLLRKNDETAKIIVWSMYPGTDIGELYGRRHRA